jgi:hypothetical protein
MKCVLISSAAVAFLLGMAATAFGDLAPPGGRKPGPGLRPLALPAFKPQQVKFSVEVDEKAKEVRLLVPIQVMAAAMGAGPPGGGFGPGVGPGGPPPGGLPPGAVPRGPAVPAEPKGGGGDPAASALRLPTIMAGLALTAAFASGGLWLVRRGAGRALLGVLVVALFVGGAAILWANARAPFPPPVPPGPGAPLPALADLPKGTPIKLPANVELNDKVTIQLLPVGDTIRLIVPKSAIKDADK